jgi:hypothetical protein
MKKIEILSAIQAELNAPKGQTNKFGGYTYRSCEDILEALKPLLAKHGAAVTLTDELSVTDAGHIYIKAKATLLTTDGEIHCEALAREPMDAKGMSPAQCTGAASSYARKYALNGLFSIDDNKDADATNTHGKEPDENIEAKKPRFAKQEEAPRKKASPSRAASAKQLSFLLTLCQESGTKFPDNPSAQEASDLISKLKDAKDKQHEKESKPSNEPAELPLIDEEELPF